MTFLMTSSSPASGFGAAGLPASPVRFPPHYSFEQYTSRNAVRHDVLRFVALAKDRRRLSISLNHQSWNTVACAWRKRRKHWWGRGASEFCTASAEIDIPFMRCVEQLSYQWQSSDIAGDVAARHGCAYRS